MTNKEFDTWFSSLTDTDKLKILGDNCQRITSTTGDTYGIEGCKWNLDAFIYQVMYEEKTGRE